jgi:hypothetical protein
VKPYTLKMNKAEAAALVDIFIRGLDNTKKSTPAEMAMVEKLTKLGEMLEDEA